tara:strand:+ start:546 stop:941 length:396 start_codon:yes stop_codon:yes gene_type:complete
MPGRGGYRKPTPSAKNVVSGIGKGSQRTDGNPSAPVAAPGGDYGSRQQIENNVAATGGLPNVKNFPNVNIDAPTDRQFESATKGTMLEGGLNNNMFLKDDVDILLDVLEKRSENNLLIAQLRNTRNAQKPF